MNTKNKYRTYIGKTLLAVAGTFLYTLGIKLFISELGLYSDGTMGISQLISSLISRFITLPGIDMAGLIYYMINIPIFFLAYKSIGKGFLLRTLVCVTTTAVFMTFMPTPATPVVSDRLLSCIIGGFISGCGIGFTLRMGGSSGGTDIIGLYCTKKQIPLSVGNISLSLNIVLYSICMIVYNVETAIYSMLFAVVASMALDRTYSMSINAEATVITKDHGQEIAEVVNHRLVRGVTSWTGCGEYTNQETKVLYIILSKYEVPTLKAMIREIDPHAFVVIKEGAKIEGNYLRKMP